MRLKLLAGLLLSMIAMTSEAFECRDFFSDALDPARAAELAELSERYNLLESNDIDLDGNRAPVRLDGFSRPTPGFFTRVRNWWGSSLDPEEHRGALLRDVLYAKLGTSRRSKAFGLEWALDRFGRRPFERALSVRIVLMGELDRSALRAVFLPRSRLNAGDSSTSYDVSVIASEFGLTSAVLRPLNLLQILKLLQFPDLYRVDFESVNGANASLDET